MKQRLLCVLAIVLALAWSIGLGTHQAPAADILIHINVARAGRCPDLRGAECRMGGGESGTQGDDPGGRQRGDVGDEGFRVVQRVDRV